MKKKIVQILNKNWAIRLFVFIFCRPKRFLFEFLFSFIDYIMFKRSVEKINWRKFDSPAVDELNSVLIVAGFKMSAQWMQIWTILAGYKKMRGFSVYVLSSRGQPIQNLYSKIFNWPNSYTMVNDSLFYSIKSINCILHYAY